MNVAVVASLHYNYHFKIIYEEPGVPFLLDLCNVTRRIVTVIATYSIYHSSSKSCICTALTTLTFTCVLLYDYEHLNVLYAVHQCIAADAGAPA